MKRQQRSQRVRALRRNVFRSAGLRSSALRSALLAAGALIALAGAASGQTTDSAPKPGFGAELIPPYGRYTLANGLTLLLLEHHELPVVDLELSFRAGSMADPEGKEGLADLTLSLLRKGTAQRTAEQIAEELDFLGGTLDLSTDIEHCGASAEFLAKDLDQGLSLLADMIVHPTFPQDELQKMVDLNVNGIKSRKENPRIVVGDYYDGTLFAGHPYGRPVGGTETSQPKLTRADVQAFHAANLRPNAAILSIAGDFQSDAMRAKVEKALADWEQRPFKPLAAAAPKPAKGRRVLVVDKADAVQTYFRIGNVGVAKGTPDTPALDVVNTVFGGRFTSWLSEELRIKSGLSYSAGSRFVQRRQPGAFYISSFTRVDDTFKAMDLALQVLDRLHAKGLSAEELDSARNYIRGQYPPNYETPGQLAGAMVELEFYGLDRGYINEHTRRTDTVTLADTRRIIDKDYPAKDLAIVMVGQAAKIAKNAAKYGPVTQKKISDPGF